MLYEKLPTEYDARGNILLKWIIVKTMEVDEKP